MKFSTAAAAAFLIVSCSSSTTSAFGVRPSVSLRTSSSAFVTQRSSALDHRSSVTDRSSSSVRKSSLLNMSYSVGIVGATGAVGKEIRGCLDQRNFPVDKLRIFGSSRSAGTIAPAGAGDKFGDITVELFDVAAARECDVVFLAVSGDFSLEHARALSDGDDGAVVIDNSVRIQLFIIYLHNSIVMMMRVYFSSYSRVCVSSIISIMTCCVKMTIQSISSPRSVT
jgi:hypothetical protein